MAVNMEREGGSRGATAARLILGAAIAAGLTWLGLALVFPYRVGPRQPIPFSHRIHAGVREISCVFCHDGVDRSPVAGMPEVSKCLLCHRVVLRDFAPIRDLRGFYDRREPIPWARVYRLMDYEHFNHEMHLAHGLDCRECHGDVKAMDRITPPYVVDMGFCVNCHRKHQATVDCTICHY